MRTTHTRGRIPLFFSLPLLLPASAAWAQAAPPAETTSSIQDTAADANASRTPTLRQIMSDPEWVARSPSNLGWSWDSASVLFDRERVGSRLSDRWTVEAEDGAVPQRIADEDLPASGARGGVYNADRTEKVFARGGDVFVRDLATGELTQITRTSGRESSPMFMADGSVAFVRGSNWIVRDGASELEYQAADVRLSDDPDEKKREADEKEPDYLTAQQRRLFAIVRDRDARGDERDAAREARDAANGTRVSGPFWLGDGTRVHTRALSPSGRWLALVVSKDPGDDRNDAMPAFVNEDGYVSSSSVRPKVGIEKRRSDGVVLIDLETERVHRMDASTLPMIGDDPLAWLKEENATPDDDRETEPDAVKATEGTEDPEPAATEAAEVETEEETEPRPYTVEQVRWSPDGTGVFFVLHSNDNKDRWIATTDLETLAGREEAGGDDEKPALTAIHHLRDEAWINWRYNEADWTRDSASVWFLSEETGYAHLYLWDRSTGETRPLTEGRFTVQGVTEYGARSMLLFRCNFLHPGEYEIGWASLSPPTEDQAAHFSTLFEMGGSVDAFAVSPDETRIAFLFSTAMDPPEIYVQGLDPLTLPERITRTDEDLFRSYEWVEPRFVEVPSSRVDDPIHCRVYDDPSMPAPSGAGKPVVLFSHGAGYTQHVYKGWSYYFREHMFHTLLCREGYIVIAPDFRASAGYGRDWRTAIYRDMGRPELEDFDDCLAWLGAEYDADLDNTGIYGGSYGGFMTLMAMFLRPDTYACGAALRSVTDWAHYNHPYTSNILNTPDIDPEAYERSSPIEHAEHLKGALLMCHGMLDDNVVAQDTVRLAQRLIELEKENWEMALYPIEPHGFLEPTGWLDEYRRIFKLFETHLKN